MPLTMAVNTGSHLGLEEKLLCDFVPRVALKNVLDTDALEELVQLVSV